MINAMRAASAVRRTGLSMGQSSRIQRRNMGVKKNAFVEEWNGRREMTEKAFSLGPKNVPILIVTCIFVPCAVAYWTGDEFNQNLAFRGKTMITSPSNPIDNEKLKGRV